MTKSRRNVLAQQWCLQLYTQARLK